MMVCIRRQYCNLSDWSVFASVPYMFFHSLSLWRPVPFSLRKVFCFNFTMSLSSFLKHCFLFEFLFFRYYVYTSYFYWQNIFQFSSKLFVHFHFLRIWRALSLIKSDSEEAFIYCAVCKIFGENIKLFIHLEMHTLLWIRDVLRFWWHELRFQPLSGGRI